MMCVKHLLVFMLLVPFPSASPVIMAIFAIALFLAVRPCGYCIAMLALLFLSTHPFSPSMTATTLFPSLNTTLTDPLPNYALDAAIPDRSWLSWNSGRIFDPVVAGYRLINYELPASEPASTLAEVSKAALDKLLEADPDAVGRPWYAPRVDLRQYGVGVVLDFGLTRSVEEIKADVRELRASNAKRIGESNDFR